MIQNPDAKLPTLPEGYSWWIDKYDLRILEAVDREEGWVKASPYMRRRNVHGDSPDDANAFYTVEHRVVDTETRIPFLLFFSRKKIRPEEQYRLVNVRKTVVSRLEHYNPSFLNYYDNGLSDNEARREFWNKVKEDGPNTSWNIQSRSEALMMRLADLLDSKELQGHYPPKEL